MACAQVVLLRSANSPMERGLNAWPSNGDFTTGVSTLVFLGGGGALAQGDELGVEELGGEGAGEGFDGGLLGRCWQAW